MKKLLYLLMVLAVLASAGFISTFQQEQLVQAQPLNDSTASVDAADVEKDGVYYVLTTATDTNDGSKLTLGDKESSIFTTDATLSKWNGDASLKVSLPPPEDKSFTWNTAIKLPAEITRIDGKLVVVPERIVYPYDDNTDLIMYELPPDSQNEGGAFEYELKLYGIPKSNIFTFNIETENLVFYYQPPLTEKQIAEGDIQPENVAGSYAVYHDSNKNNEYKTGKAYHIYRPKVTDSTGSYVWAELNIDSKAGIMTITVDLTWLEKAIYPIMVDPTFGKTVKGGTASSTGSSNTIDGVVYTGAAGVGVSITVYVMDNGGDPGYAKFALYRMSDNVFVMGTTEWDIPISWDNWETLNFTSNPTITAQSYAICYFGGGTNVRYYDTGVDGDEKRDANTYPTWTDPASWLDYERLWSQYCTYIAPPTLHADAADDITYSTATLNGEITNNGGENADYYKFEWDTDSGAPYANSWTSGAGSYGVAAYDHGITDLTCGETIYFRFSAHNTGGWSNSSELNFAPTSCSTPAVTTGATTNITTSAARLNGSIDDDGGDVPDYYRFEWDIDTGAPYANYYQSATDEYPEGSYYRDISSLSAGTEIFARFGAHNIEGTGWGNETKFLTLPVKPSLLVDGTKTSETIAYTWTKGAGAGRTMIRYSSVSYPTAIDEGTQAYYDTGSSTTITGLSPSTYYYVSAWSEITTDGMQQFSADYATDAAWTRPDDVIVCDAGNFTVNSADLTWTIPDGADNVRIRKKVDSAPTTPTDGSHVYYGTGTAYTASGLDPNSHYYFGFWGYDTDSGLYSENPCTADDYTLIDAPIITNDIGASNVGKTSATLNGAVSYTGGESPTAYFYWGTTDEGEDRFAWEHEEDMGTRSGSFSKPLDSLTEGETYYYRTYGENSAGSDWADSTEQFTCGCLAVEDFEVTQINDYQFDMTWTPKAVITTIRMGIDNPPANAFDGTLVYRGNGTATSWYCDTQCTSGNMTFRAWSDCTACLTCTTPAFSDTYEEDSVILSGSCGGGSGDMTKAEYDLDDDGIVNEADYAALAGNSTYSITSGNSTYSITAGDADTLDTHHWSEIPSAGDMFKSTYDTNDDGVVDEADFAALAGDSDTLDGHHWIEIPGGGGNVTFVTDAGNVTGTLFYLLGSGTISTSGSGDTIIINGTTFLSLPDTPDSYTGQAGRYVAVNGNETAVVFVDAPSGDLTVITDSGNATSIAGVMSMLGSGNTTTSASGSTVTIDSTGNVTAFTDLTIVADSGNATSVDGVIYMLGEDAIATGGNGSAVSISGSASADTFRYIGLPDGSLLTANGEDTLYLDGTDILFTTNGEVNTIEASIGGDNVDTLASNSTVALALSIPFLLGLIGAWRHSLTGYIAGILGLSLSLGILQNDIGLSITIPVIVVILGLGLALVRDAWTQGVEIF